MPNNQDKRIDIGLEILSLRIEENLTQEALAKKIGTKQPAFARIERGRILPNIRFLEKIAEATKRILFVTFLKQDKRITNGETHTAICQYEI